MFLCSVKRHILHEEAISTLTAFAITIHKSQGLSLKSAVIDVGWFVGTLTANVWTIVSVVSIQMSAWETSAQFATM